MSKPFTSPRKTEVIESWLLKNRIMFTVSENFGTLKLCVNDDLLYLSCTWEKNKKKMLTSISIKNNRYANEKPRSQFWEKYNRKNNAYRLIEIIVK